jgi:NAD/NADP transhydrogenase beta subunit
LVYIFFVLFQAFDFYAGLDIELFYMYKTMMVFGDAKKVIEDMVKAVE